MCGQNLPVRAGLGSVPFVDVGAERAGRARHSEQVWRMEDHKAQYRATVAESLRDQSEDREMPPYFAVPVQNPSGVLPGLYYAVYHRATMVRVSVWFPDAAQADETADTWADEFGDIASNPVNPAAANMVWDWPETWADFYEYQP